MIVNKVKSDDLPGFQQADWWLKRDYQNIQQEVE